MSNQRGKQMARIDLNDTGMSALVKMAEGNPGAISAMASLMKVAEKIDPDSAVGAFGPILSLDTHGIYGARIWMLYKDVCRQDNVACLALLRAVQLGGLAGVTESALNHAIDNYGEGVDATAAIGAVQQALPRFAAERAEAS